MRWRAGPVRTRVDKPGFVDSLLADRRTEVRRERSGAPATVVNAGQHASNVQPRRLPGLGVLEVFSKSCAHDLAGSPVLRGGDFVELGVDVAGQADLPRA